MAINLAKVKIRNKAADSTASELLRGTLSPFFDMLLLSLVKGLCDPFISPKTGNLLYIFSSKEREVHVWRYYDETYVYPWQEFGKILVPLVCPLAHKLDPHSIKAMPTDRKERHEMCRGIASRMYEWDGSAFFNRLRDVEGVLLHGILLELERQFPSMKESEGRLPEIEELAEAISEKLLNETDIEVPRSILQLFLTIYADLILQCRKRYRPITNLSELPEAMEREEE